MAKSDERMCTPQAEANAEIKESKLARFKLKLKVTVNMSTMENLAVAEHMVWHMCLLRDVKAFGREVYHHAESTHLLTQTKALAELLHTQSKEAKDLVELLHTQLKGVEESRDDSKSWFKKKEQEAILAKGEAADTKETMKEVVKLKEKLTAAKKAQEDDRVTHEVAQEELCSDKDALETIAEEHIKRAKVRAVESYKASEDFQRFVKSSLKPVLAEI
ncbi:hypothetical protein NE237_007052 [Protea cynaroides]|uniref:Uncharacterized protein n=1 Tax=Protea cynaroides TaxID=273540 RepID=A0A9Q0KNE3_9MAGN|nr:hypothetical protein NE237_007052 [Protea cynaroides]